MAEFRMPQLGADMAAGILVEWLKEPGDEVRRGDIIAVVETDKGAIEIEVFENGMIESLLVEPGTKVPVGTALAILDGPAGAAGESAPAPAPKPPGAATPPDTAPPPATAEGTTTATAEPAAVRAPRQPAAPRPAGGPAARVRISPAAARLAAEHGVNIATLRGTGPGGAIRIADIEAARRPPPAGPDAPEGARDAAPAAAMRRAIGAAMARSKREIPHYYLATTVDMAAAMAWLEEANAARPVTDRLLSGVLLLKAVAVALRAFPEFNGYWREDRFEPAPAIHVGVAVAVRGGGLMAPALHDVDRLSVDALMAALRDLVARARALRLRSSELSDPTITVTSLGERGVEEVFGVIHPPQVAMVGFGRPFERPAPGRQGEIAMAPAIRASLSADHRVSDGRRGALFLNAIADLLQEPGKL